MKMPCRRSNQKPGPVVITQRTQELDRHHRRAVHHPPYLFLIASLCLWGQGENLVIWLFSLILVGLCQNFALVWLSLLLLLHLLWMRRSYLPGQQWALTGDTWTPACLLSEVPVCWPFLFWTQALSCARWPLSAPHLPYRNPWEHPNSSLTWNAIKGPCSAAGEAPLLSKYMWLNLLNMTL